MGAFEDLAGQLIDDGIAQIKANIDGTSYVSITKDWPKTKYIEYQVLENFTYNHDAQDINHGCYHFKKGEIISLRDESNSWFTPDETKLKKIGEKFK